MVESRSPKPLILVRIQAPVQGENLKKKENKVAGIRAYIEETVNELVHKVSWPTSKELQSSAIIVLIASVIFAVIVFLMDFIFGIQSMSQGQEGFVWKGVLGYFYDFFK